MRIFVLILLLANVVLFAYIYEGQRSRTAPAALAQQIKPERIRLMTAQEVVALSPGVGVCVELGPLTPEQATQVRDSLAAIEPAAELSERQAVDEARGAPVVFLQVRDMSEALRKRINEHANDTAAELQWCPPQILQADS